MVSAPGFDILVTAVALEGLIFLTFQNSADPTATRILPGFAILVSAVTVRASYLLRAFRKVPTATRILKPYALEPELNPQPSNLDETRNPKR